MVWHFMWNEWTGAVACGNRGSLESSTTHPEQVTCLACAQILQDEQDTTVPEAEAERLAVGFGQLKTWE